MMYVCMRRSNGIGSMCIVYCVMGVIVHVCNGLYRSIYKVKKENSKYTVTEDFFSMFW